MSHHVAVYCGSNLGVGDAYSDTARRLGATLAGRGIGVVYGGGHVGLMGAVADAALAAGGEVHGVITDGLVQAEIAHTGLTSLTVVPTMHERKARMAALADGVVVLPGGFGTLDETLELLTWNQLGLLAAPVVVLDVDGYYDGLFAWCDRAVEAGFMKAVHRGLAQRTSSVDEAVELALAPTPPVTPKWITDGAGRP